MAHKISIWKHLSECCYYEQESGFRVHLYEFLKDPSRIEQLAKDGYIILNRYLDRVDRAPEIDFLMTLKVHFLDLEKKRELYRTGDSDPYNLFLYHPGGTPKLQSQSTIELRAVIDSHTICYEASRAYMDVIYCDTHRIGSQEKEYLVERYGKPSYIEESKGEQYSPGGYIVIPVDDVDKLIAIERFRELDDTDQEPIYTGEERIYELDLRSPDESIYKYFVERRIIVEYDPEKFAPRYLYSSSNEIKAGKLSPKGRHLPSWIRFLYQQISRLSFLNLK